MSSTAFTVHKEMADEGVVWWAELTRSPGSPPRPTRSMTCAGSSARRYRCAGDRDRPSRSSSRPPATCPPKPVRTEQPIIAIDASAAHPWSRVSASRRSSQARSGVSGHLPGFGRLLDHGGDGHPVGVPEQHACVEEDPRQRARRHPRHGRASSPRSGTASMRRSAAATLSTDARGMCHQPSGSWRAPRR